MNSRKTKLREPDTSPSHQCVCGVSADKPASAALEKQRVLTLTGFSTLLVLIVLLGIRDGHGQHSIISDGFSDGNFTQKPVWSGDTSDFDVVKREQNYLLQINDQTADGEAYLTTPISGYIGRWTIYTELLFAPSSNNRVEIFLASNTSNLFDLPSGYALQGGETGSGDVFRLVYYRSGSIVDTLLQDTLNISNGGGYTIQVDHRSDHQWKLSTGRNYGERLHHGQTTHHQTKEHLTHFGIRAWYSSTRADKFYFDFSLDLPPLSISSSISNQHHLQLTFNQPIDTVHSDRQTFTISDIGNPNHIEWLNQRTVVLTYPTTFAGGAYRIYAHDLIPLFNSQTDRDLEHLFFHFDSVTPRSGVVINEFMPAPPDGLAEYVEVYNPTQQWLNAANWQIGDANKLVPLAVDATIPLKPNSYLILTPDSAALSGHFGPGPYRQVSSWPSLNNGGDAIRLYTNAHQPIDSLTYSSTPLEPGRALERRSVEAPSRLTSNWRPSLNHRGSPGRPNTIPAERSVPYLSNISYRENRVLQLHFSEPIATNRVQKHLQINTGGDEQTLLWSLPAQTRAFEQTISLSLTAGMRNTQRYHIEIDTLADAYGNTNILIDTTFTFYQTGSADSASIYISEFMYDPPPSQSEYIELYNAADYAVDLSKLRIADKSSTPVPLGTQEHIFPPNSYRVLASRDSHNLPSNSIQIDNFPTLNNGGDAIVLLNSRQTLLDSLFYVPVWGGAEKALQRRSYKAAATYISNWSVSQTEAAGTPGTVNDVTADTSAPGYRHSEVFHERALRFHFDEVLKRPSKPVHYYFESSPALTAMKGIVRDSTYFILLQDAMSSNTEYQMTLKHIADPFGNQMPDTTIPIRFIPTTPSLAGDIIINEINIGNPHPYPAFIELYNASDKTINVGGWTITSQYGTIALPPTNDSELIVEPDNFLVITSTPIDIHNQYLIPSLLSWSNRADELLLSNAVGTPIDSVRYRRSRHDQAGSIEKTDPLIPGIDWKSWHPASDSVGHTAGYQNSIFLPDTLPPRLQYAYVADTQRVRLVFDEFVSLKKDAKIYLNRTKLNRLSNAPLPPNQIALQTHPSLYPREMNRITISGIGDWKGNKAVAKIEAQLAYTPHPDDLIFTEVLFDPIRDSRDDLINQSEYVEFFNVRNFPLYIGELKLRGEMDETGDKDLKMFKQSTSSIEAGEYGVIFGDTATHVDNTALFKYYDIPRHTPVLQLDALSLSLNKARDSLFLYSHTHGDIASLYYQNNWHTSNVSQTKGVSLEKMFTDASSFTADSWGSSAADRGGTPGERNSIQKPLPEMSSTTRFQLTPNPFSPDGDGFEDHITLHYNFHNSGHYLDVQIFDRYGRSVRTISSDDLSGTRGQLSWNGMNDKGTPCRIGTYIFLIESYNPVTERYRKFKKTAVLARRL